MKKIVVTNRKTGALIHEHFAEEIDQAWLEKELHLNSWGKSARWLPDFLEGVETRIVGEGEFAQTEYLWPQEYTYEITDISNDYDYLLQKCYANRIKDYGTIAEQLDMQYHGTWHAHIQNVKDKYPKPKKEI